MPPKTKNQSRRDRLLNKKISKEDKKFIDSLIEENKKTHIIEDVKSNTALNPNPALTSLSISDIVKKASEMWKAVKKYQEDNPDFKDLADKKKLDFFRNKMGYAEIMTELPIVTRYMICLGQYSAKSLEKVLKKTQTMKHPPPEKREKNYMEDQWVRRQADYVQYMWEHYQRGKHYNNAEKKWIWEHTYKLLKGEFDDFRNLHKDAEEKVKEEKKVLAGKNLRDLAERLKTGKQKLTAEEEKFMKDEMFKILSKNAFNSVMKELKETYEPVAPACVGVGHGPENPAPKPKITMIETVDAERMDEIDDKYKSDDFKGKSIINDDFKISDTSKSSDSITSNAKKSELLPDEVIEEVV
jgi:hypothetical protein